MHIGTYDPLLSKKKDCRKEFSCLSCLDSLWLRVPAGLLGFAANNLAAFWIKFIPYTGISIAATTCMGLAFVYLLNVYLRWTPFYVIFNKAAREAAMKVTDTVCQP